MRSHHYHDDCWRCRGCTMMVIIGDDNGDDEIGDAEGA